MINNKLQVTAWADIIKANGDLQDRLFKDGVNIAYDEDSDILFLTIGEGKESITKQAIDDLFVRVEPGSLKVTGCFIVGFARDFLAKNKVVRKIFPDALGKLRAEGNHLEWKGAQAVKTSPVFELAISH